MGVYELSGAGSVKTGRTLYTSMNAGNQFGAMVPIASADPANTVDRVTFSNIPTTFQDLMLVATMRTQQSSNQGSFQYYVNGDTTTLYSFTFLQGDGATATSSRSTGQSVGLGGNTVGNTATAGIFSSAQLHILNYANAATFKTFLSRTAADVNGSGTTHLSVGLYRSTNAINSLSVGSFGFNFVAGSTFTLYGIKAVSS